MKLNKQLLALLLVCVMLLPMITACDPETQGGEVDFATTGAEENTTLAPEDPKEPSTGGEEESTEAPDPETEPILWGGEEYLVLTQLNDYEIYVSEYNPSSYLQAALYERNENMKRKYEITVKAKAVAGVYATAVAALEAGDDVYELMVLSNPAEAQTLAGLGYLTDLTAQKYINTDHKAWNQNVTEQFTFGGKCYYNVGDLLLRDEEALNVILYNRELARTKNYGYLENMLEANTWTMGEAINIMRAFSYELDTDGVRTSKDAFGLTADTKARFSAFCVGAGLSFMTKNENGEAELSGYREEMGKAIQAALTLCFDKRVDWFTPGRYFVSDIKAPVNFFIEGRALFHCTTLGEVDEIMNQFTYEYGFLPYPKLSSEQEQYRTLVDYDKAAVFAIPKTAKSDYAAYGLQVLMEQSAITVQYALFDQLSRTDYIEVYHHKVLELLSDTAVYDAILYLNYGGINKLISYTIPAMEADILKVMYPQISKRSPEQAISQLPED